MARQGPICGRRAIAAQMRQGKPSLSTNYFAMTRLQGPRNRWLAWRRLT